MKLSRKSYVVSRKTPLQISKPTSKMEPTRAKARGSQGRNTKAPFIPALKGGVFERRSIKFVTGFTLIELIITIVLVGIILIPLGIMSIEYMREIVYSRNLGDVEALARLELAKVNNLSYGDATLAAGYDNTTSNYEGYPYDLRRTVSFANAPVNTLKKVQVRIYPSAETAMHLLNAITYVADISFGAGSAGGSTSSGGQSDYLVISSGVVSSSRLQQIDMQNTHATDTITVSQVTVSWTNLKPDRPASLTQIQMNGITRWSGTQSASGATISLTTPFTLSANTAYTNTGIFTFSQNIQSVTVTFIMSDSSASPAMIW